MRNSKKQSRKVGVAGGFINQLMGNNSTEPKVGEGATILHYSDRTPYEVIWVSEDGLSCKIREMKATHIGESYGDERYTYKSNPESVLLDIKWNKRRKKWCSVHVSYSKGKRVLNPISIIFGVAEKYRDPSF